jgi:hypothetical protein
MSSSAYVVIAYAQLETEPHPLDTSMKGITKFSESTGIRGSVRYIEKNRQALWLNLEQRSDASPLYETGWNFVPGDATLAVQSRDSEQWEKLSNLSKGLPLELIVQDDGKGTAIFSPTRIFPVRRKSRSNFEPALFLSKI